MQSETTRILAYSLVATLAVVTLIALLPQDPAAASTSAEAVHIFKCTGLAGILLLLNLFVGVGALARSLRRCSHARLGDPALLRQVEAHVREGETDPALQVARKKGGFAGNVLASGLGHADPGGDGARRAMLDATAAETAKEYASLALLSLSGNVGSLLGLLGTVSGILSCFRILEFLKRPTPADMSFGMYGALGCTALGTFSAVAFLSAYFLLKARTAQILPAVNDEISAVLAQASSAPVSAVR